jgi:YggT family protein
MTVVQIIATVVYFALNVFVFAMWARFALDLARVFARQWRPRGFLLVLAELVYTITDPPVRAVRRIIPPLRVGGGAIDFGWSIVMLAAIILVWITRGFMN